MPRYVILEHDYPMLHWDFMLESAMALRTWRLALMPALGEVIAATPLGEHRLAYLDYEGPLNGNRGAVKRWDQGDYEAIRLSDEFVEVRLRGRRLSGKVILEQRGPDWQFRWLSK
jgi:hypothetical protein